MKAKFATYMEVDLQGMTTTELLVLKKELDVVLHGRKTTEDPIVTNIIKDVRAINALSDLFRKDMRETKLSDIAGKMTLQQVKKLRNVGNKAIKAIDDALIMYGHKPLH